LWITRDHPADPKESTAVSADQTSGENVVDTGARIENVERENVEYTVQSLKQRLKLSNDVSDTIRFCLPAQSVLDDAQRKPWSQVQPLLIHPCAARAVRLLEARISLESAPRANAIRETVFWLRRQLALPPEQLDPAPLLLGHDLIALGQTPSVRFRELLGTARRMQLDLQLPDRAAALEWLRSQVDS
jgi:hypothetical protein